MPREVLLFRPLRSNHNCILLGQLACLGDIRSNLGTVAFYVNIIYLCDIMYIVGVILGINFYGLLGVVRYNSISILYVIYDIYFSVNSNAEMIQFTFLSIEFSLSIYSFLYSPIVNALFQPGRNFISVKA